MKQCVQVDKDIAAGTHITFASKRKEEVEKYRIEMAAHKASNPRGDQSADSSCSPGKTGKLFHTDSQRRIWKKT